MKRHLKIDTNRENNVPAPVRVLSADEIKLIYGVDLTRKKHKKHHEFLEIGSMKKIV